MPAPKRILTLSIGSQTISLAKFEKSSKGGIELKAIETRKLLADPAADATRSAQAALLISEMATAMKADGLPVRMTLPALSTFTRMVKIPVVGGSLAQTVAFEAQQNIPYALSEVVWDFRPASDPKAPEPEVLIAAAKNEILDEWLGALESAAFQPSGIDVAAVSLYNAFRYNYGEPQGCSLLMDLGARTTNLIFIESGKFFIRTLSSGGATLTASVAKEFGESFSSAEQRKLDRGFVGQGSNFSEPSDPNEAKLAKVLRNAATRLHAEVARSISFYRSQQGGSAPQRVLICGGGTRLPLMREFWEEKLGTEVELFHPMRCVSAPGIEASVLREVLPLMGEHVGLALQVTTACPLTLNLLPKRLTKLSKANEYATALWLATACICAPLIAWGMHLNHHAKLAQRLLERIAPQIARQRAVNTEIQSTRAEIEAILAQSAPLQRLPLDRQYWVSLLDQIHESLPQDGLWLTSFDTNPIETAPNPAEVASVDSRKNTPSKEKQPTQPKDSKIVVKGFLLCLDKDRTDVEVYDKFVESLRETGKISCEYHSLIQKIAQSKKSPAKESPSEAEQQLSSLVSKLAERGIGRPPTAFEVPPLGGQEEGWARPARRTLPNADQAPAWVEVFSIPLQLKDAPAKALNALP